MHISEETGTQEQKQEGVIIEKAIDKGPQMCYFIAMSSRCASEASSPKEENYKYLLKRWKAALAGLNLTSKLGSGREWVLALYLQEFDK